ncbi:MAG: NYN domain-containing protein [Planctomycetota bacterium]
MSLLLLIDGYNVAAPINPGRGADAGWLHRHRQGLLRDLANHLDEDVRAKTCVVFDANDPPRNRSSEETYKGIQIRFAVGYLSADDLLEELIQSHHTPKRLMVVSSDHRVQVAARRRGATHYDSEPWMDDLTDGLVHLAIPSPKRRDVSTDGAGQGSGKKPSVNDADEVDEWMREFGFDE